MKKQLFLSLIILFPLISACSNSNTDPDSDYDGLINEVDNNPNDNSFKGKMNFGSVECFINYKIDYRELINGNHEKFSSSLATWSLLLAHDIYSGNSLEIENAIYNPTYDDDREAFYKQLGCSTFYYYDTAKYEKFNKEDISDQSHFIIADNYTIYHGNKYHIAYITIMGSSTDADWISNMDVGCSTTDYNEKVSGEHKEWTNKNNHKGFDISANRTLEIIDNHIKENNYEDDTIYFITGHSRGAAIANLVGKSFEDKKYNSFTYTFASPCTTTNKEKAEQYKTIFNVINYDDLIAYFPFSSLGFTHYGIDKIVSVYEHKDTFKELTDASYSYSDIWRNNLQLIGSSRNDLYKIDENNVGTTFSFDSEEECQKEIEELKSLAEKYSFEKYINFSAIKWNEDDESYCFEVYNCPALVFFIVYNAVKSSGIDISMIIKTTQLLSNYSSVISDFVAYGITNLFKSHFTCSYYIVTLYL